MTNWAFKREELYELVWSEPMKTLAKDYGISDVALSKNCRKHGIPVPPRGYWAKLQAGKKVAKQPLPPRGIGLPEIIRGGGNSHWARYSLPQDLIDIQLPPPPEFPEPMEGLRDRVRKLVGKVTIPRDFSKAHRLVAKLLNADEVRQQNESHTTWELFMETFKQQTPFDIQIIDSSGTFLGVMEFSTVNELCRHMRHHGLPEGQAFCLSGLDLRGGYLRQARLAGADLSKCNLEGVCLSGADLSGANLEGANLNGCSLKNASLRGARLRRAKLVAAGMWWADLESADLEQADLRHANLNGACMEGANMAGADLGAAALAWADFESTNLEGASLHEVYARGSFFRGADMHGADISGAFLDGVDFRTAHLKGARIDKADMRGVHVVSAQLRRTTGKPSTAPPVMAENVERCES